MDAIPAYTSRTLDAATLPRAYPLLQAAYGLELDAWVRYLSAAEDGPLGCEGMMAVEDNKGYVVGVLRFRICRDPLSGRVLDCDHVLVPDSPRFLRLFDYLIEGGEALASRHGCDRLNVTIAFAEPADAAGPASGADQPFRQAMTERGFALDGVRFSKSLVAERAASIARRA